MARLLRGLLKWTVLAAVAVALGTSIGAAVATTMKPPVVEEAVAPAEEPLEPEVPEEEQVGLEDRTAPPAPTPTSPADGAMVSWRPLLAWAPVADASNVIYAVQFSTDPGFPDEASTTIRNLEAPEWRPPNPLPPLVKHYWRVYALDAGLNQGPWSEARAFTPVLPLDAAVDEEGATAELHLVLPPP